MKIVDVVCAPGRTGFFFDDQKAIKSGAVSDGAAYIGTPVTPGFKSIRQAGESISVMLVLEDGQIAWGDCAAVQYSGAGGRDPLFLAEDFIPVIDKYTKATKRLMSEVVADEYGTTVSDKPIPIFTQSGDNRYENADKMILKGAAILPHALINNVETKLGRDGSKLKEYVCWLRDRILKLRTDESYNPIFHIDVYGTIGQAFGDENYTAMADYLAELEEAAKPFHLRIEGPMDAGEREKQMLCLKGLREEVDRRGINVELVADEWCNTLEDVIYFCDNKAGHMAQIKTPDLGGINNTIEAVLYCKQHNFGAYQGGTCNETDRSCQVCVDCAMATQPDQILAKPGMGVDEGYMIVYNEMNRVIALRNAKKK